jgi:hypothetical protein
VVALKQKAFTRVLDMEESHLPNSIALIADLRRCVAALSTRSTA